MKITVLEQPDTENEAIILCKDAKCKEVQDFLNLVGSLENKIPSKQDNKVIFISPMDILYCEYVNRTVFIYTSENVYPTSLSLSQLTDNYSRFFRCSKSMSVNLSQISHLKSSVSGGIIATLSNGEKIIISRHYASFLREKLLITNK